MYVALHWFERFLCLSFIQPTTETNFSFILNFFPIFQQFGFRLNVNRRTKNEQIIIKIFLVFLLIYFTFIEEEKLCFNIYRFFILSYFEVVNISSTVFAGNVFISSVKTCICLFNVRKKPNEKRNLNKKRFFSFLFSIDSNKKDLNNLFVAEKNVEFQYWFKLFFLLFFLCISHKLRTQFIIIRVYVVFSLSTSICRRNKNLNRRVR